MFETWHKMIAMLQSGLEVRKVITHRLPVERFLEGFEIMRRGDSGQDRARLDVTVAGRLVKGFGGDPFGAPKEEAAEAALTHVRDRRRLSELEVHPATTALRVERGTHRLRQRRNEVYGCCAVVRIHVLSEASQFRQT